MDPGALPDPVHERFVRTFLDWVMLSIIRKKPSFGYEMITAISDEYGVLVSPGSLYPILYDLEHAGLIAGTWDEPGRKSRKIYRLTPDGERGLDALLVSFNHILSTLKKENGRSGH